MDINEWGWIVAIALYFIGIIWGLLMCAEHGASGTRVVGVFFWPFLIIVVLGSVIWDRMHES